MGEFWSPRVKGIPRKENAQAETDSRGSKVDEGAMSRWGKGEGDRVDSCAQERVPITPGWGTLVELWPQALD